MIKIDDKELRELERDFKTFAKRAYPYATRSTVNASAFAAQKESRSRIKDQFVNRNRHAQQSVQVEQARTLDVRRQEAVVGSVADYMEVQEFGGSKRRTGRHGVAIPTSYSAGQAIGAQPRTRLPRKPNKLQAIQLRERRRVGKTRGQRNLVAVKEAAAAGTKYVFLDLGRKRGIFRVLGGKRRPRIRMVHDLSEQTVAIPKAPWLRPSVDKVATGIPERYRDALIFQARRNGLFGYK